MRLEVPPEGGHLSRRKSTADYRIDHATGCWNWLKGLTKQGYPFGHAHRKYYERAHGEIPAGFHVHHECRNPLCVNPAHLRPITPDEHYVLHYLEDKGLTLDDVREIRRLGRSAKTVALELVELYGVTDMTIYFIWNGRSWARLLGEEGPVRPTEDRPPCATCGVTVPAERRRHAKYCSKACRVRMNSRDGRERKRARQQDGASHA